MRQPIIADDKPIAVTLEKGKKYFWCSCGRSQNQPFCDGSHQGTDFQPLAFTAEKDGEAFLCQCKRSSNPPFCDGSHKAITQEDLDADQGLETVWYKVAEPNALQAGEVRSVQAGSKTIALTYFNDEYGALDNACPHQGGPLSEGSIECEGDECWLRCPWHGWDFHPLSGKSPGGFDDGVDTHPVEVRDDGIYVQVKERRERTRTVSDLMVETMVNWGVTHVFGMVGHTNLGLADAMREQEEAGRMSVIGIRHEGPALVEIISDPELI